MFKSSSKINFFFLHKFKAALLSLFPPPAELCVPWHRAYVESGRVGLNWLDPMEPNAVGEGCDSWLPPVATSAVLRVDGDGAQARPHIPGPGNPQGCPQLPPPSSRAGGLWI